MKSQHESAFRNLGMSLRETTSRRGAYCYDFRYPVDDVNPLVDYLTTQGYNGTESLAVPGAMTFKKPTVSLPVESIIFAKRKDRGYDVAHIVQAQR